MTGEMIIRGLIYLVFFIALSGGVIYYGFNPKTEIVKGGKLALPENIKAKENLALGPLDDIPIFMPSAWQFAS